MGAREEIEGGNRLTPCRFRRGEDLPADAQLVRIDLVSKAGIPIDCLFAQNVRMYGVTRGVNVSAYAEKPHVPAESAPIHAKAYTDSSITGVLELCSLSLYRTRTQGSKLRHVFLSLLSS